MKRITTEHAKTIAKKLGCSFREGKAHTEAEVFEGDILVASFGIRRGSGELGHGHVPSNLHLKQMECARLYECTLDRAGYIKLMIDKGELQAKPAQPPDSPSFEKK